MDARATVDEIYRLESRRVLATLIRLLGDFDRAEEAMHDAFVAAVEQWARDGVPANPRAWLVSTGRFKAIDNRQAAGPFRSVPGGAGARAGGCRRGRSHYRDR
jgi:RNA polymerase sigma-70 factor (ECF subfamily)